MSVQYPHRADVPVTDLDEPDDLFVGPQNTAFIDSFDYEHEQPTFVDKAKRFFRFQDNNLQDSDFFDIDDDDETDLPRRELRDYAIRRINQKLNRTILVFAAALVLLLLLFFWRQRPRLQKTGDTLHVLSNGTHTFRPSTVLVSLDGFHPHYISAETTPALHRMMIEEYGAPYMTPSFPSSTFPNHWTLVTGLYPADHGIVGNTFFDPRLQRQFINTNPLYGLDPDFWRGGQPIWTTAALQGVKSAVHMWPGSEVPTIGDNGPIAVDHFNGTEPLAAKVDRVMGWLDLEDQKRPELVLTYVPTIDQYGHRYGVSGAELEDALLRVDAFVAQMAAALAERNLTHIVNLVVVSDHGMAPTSNERLLFLDDVVDTAKIGHVDGWPLYGLRPKKEYSVDSIYEDISNNMAKLGIHNFTLYRVEDMPREWNFGGQEKDHLFNYRLAPLWIVPDVGYSITTHKQFEENDKQYKPKGVHGYNNSHMLMRALFVAQGPYFDSRLGEKKKVLPFANTDVYNIVCESIGINPAPSNGTSQGARGYAISSEQLLPDDWTDEVSYPDVPFDFDHLVRNATVDALWGRKKIESEGANETEEPETKTETKAEETKTDTNAAETKTETETENTVLETATTQTKTETELESKTGTIEGETSALKGVNKIWEDVEDAALEVGGMIEDAVHGAGELIGSLFGDD